MSRFDRHHRVVSVTMVWNRQQDDSWERFLIREQADTNPYVTKLISVQANVPVCMACLSNDVTVVESDTHDDGELLCYSCGVRYGIV